MKDFELPDELAAIEPPEAHGVARDQVRLLVASRTGVTHAHFAGLATFLRAGDLVVVNTSATLAAAVDGRRGDGRPVTVHFAAALDNGDWVVELRPTGAATGPLRDVRADDAVTLPNGVRLDLVGARTKRLWRARIRLEGRVEDWLARTGRPIRYAYVTRPWPLADYQTVFARQAGSAEMPSAGRPFTAELVTDLITSGISVAPITLHAGVSSPEIGEPPQPERFSVPPATAALVNLTRESGGRVVAVGTTVTRALESTADRRGGVLAARGWTDLVLGRGHPARVVDGLITGWHAPGASHLDLLEAVAGPALVDVAYTEALRERYQWHEFGDSCLLLA
jgi:S-adenosylmethionine:tRNA ribosyltransferase-isomerase